MRVTVSSLNLPKFMMPEKPTVRLQVSA